MTETMFWSSVFVVLYAYIGYPLTLAFLAGLKTRPILTEQVTPYLSFIIAVRNEEARIERKLQESLALDYPADRLDIIVASDASTDATHEIVARYTQRGVSLVVSPERRGKEFAQRAAIKQSRGEILVFSDVATRLDKDGLRTLARNFADPTVGCASSVDKLLRPDGSVSGEGMYVRYEMWLRALESRFGTVVGLSGSLFAARRSVCEAWSVDMPSDFNTLLNALRAGLRGVSDEASAGYYPDLADSSREYQRKVRTVTRGISSLLRNVDVLNPLKYGWSAWQLASHKLCRWLVPFALIVAVISNAALALRSVPYLVMAVAQLVAFVTAAIGVAYGHRSPVVVRLLGYFFLTNVSILHAWFNVLTGRSYVTWEPSKRPDVVHQ